MKASVSAPPIYSIKVMKNRDLFSKKTSVNSMEREKAFADTLRNEGKTLHPEWIFHQCYTMQDGAQILHRIVNMKNRPTAILQRTIKLQLVY